MLTKHLLNLLADLGTVCAGLVGVEALTLSTGLALTTALTLPSTRLALTTGLTLSLSRLGHPSSPAPDASGCACAVLQLPRLLLVGPHELSLLVGQTLATLALPAALALLTALATLSLLPALPLLAGHAGSTLPASTLRTHRRNRGNYEREYAEDRDCLCDTPHGVRSLLALVSACAEHCELEVHPLLSQVACQIESVEEIHADQTHNVFQSLWHVGDNALDKAV
jgi:hypothetical protein